MFLVNQIGDKSYNVDTIDYFATVENNNTASLPSVAAIIGNTVAKLGVYGTLEDCHTAIGFISYSINNNEKLLKMPSQNELSSARKKWRALSLTN